MAKKYGGEVPKLDSGVASIGSMGNPKGAGGQKSRGGRYPFLPTKYDGAMGSGAAAGETANTTMTKFPDQPDKPK